MQSITEDEIPYVDPAETEERFRTIDEGESFDVYVKLGRDKFVVFNDVEVTSARQTTTEKDDFVSAKTRNGEAMNMTLRWYPQEPNVGIPRPYPEGPIMVESGDVSGEVLSIVV